MRYWQSPDGRRFRIGDPSIFALNGAEKVERYLRETVVGLLGDDPDVLFGENVPFEKIKFTDWVPDTCDGEGCRVRYAWRRDSGEPPSNLPRVHYPHKVLRACQLHRHHADPISHITALWAENGGKNRAVAEYAKVAGVEASRVEWQYDEKRRLVLRVSGTTAH